MPVPSGLMNDNEREICARLREVRVRVGCSQEDFGKLLGITRDRVVTIDMARSPLRYWMADAVCNRFEICQRWLATGFEPMGGYVRFPPEIGVEVGHDETFSAVYHRILSHRVERAILETEWRKTAAFAGADAAQPDRMADNYAYELARAFFHRVPVELRQEFYGWLAGAAGQFLQTKRDKLPPVQLPQENEKKELTESYVGRKSEHMKSPLRSLLDRLVYVTAAYGKKAALAQALGVPQSRVSEWLHGKGEPSGEVTLLLLEWVTAEEAQQKENPGSVQPPPGRKAHSTQSKHEKGKTGPP
jgi:transcriptional regulator with XRE-family HTH domain